jgi:predicted Zn finger-like uncharacterized protein
VFTQCSKCETVFKLSAEVLRAAGGQVRCGKCGEVFNALAHLAEDPSAFATSEAETELDLETRADAILESPAPPTPRDAPPARRQEDHLSPGVEIARLQILDWNDGDSPGETAAAAPALTSNHEEVEDGVEEMGETSMEFTLPPGELDRIFVETKKGARPLMPQPAGEEIEVFNAAAPTPAAEVPAGAAAAPAGFEVPEDVRREMLSGIERPSDAEPLLEPKRRVRRVTRRASPFDLAPPESTGSRAKWLAGAIAAGVLLLVQMIHHNREWLAAHTPLGMPLRALYSMTSTPVAPPANLSAYQLRQWGVTGDPAGAGTLRVRASILNTAAQLEPYPLLRVTLANRFGGSIGTRDFEPSEYLGKPTAKLLAPGERADATLDILDPGKNAEGFEIDVCLRSADRRVACANDKAPSDKTPAQANR